MRIIHQARCTLLLHEIGKSQIYAYETCDARCDKTGYDGIRDDFTGPNLAFDSRSNAKDLGFIVVCHMMLSINITERHLALGLWH